MGRRTLQIVVLNGRRIPIDSSYVKFRWHGEKHKTSVGRGSNPVWNKTFEVDFHEIDYHRSLEVHVWHCDTILFGINEPIAQCHIKLADLQLVPNVPVQKEYKLFELGGYISLRFCLVDRDIPLVYAAPPAGARYRTSPVQSPSPAVQYAEHPPQGPPPPY